MGVLGGLWFDDVHARSLRAALVTGGTWGGCLEVVEWILPHGGAVTVDGTARRVTADCS